MKFLSNSNGVRKIDMKKELNPKVFIRNTIVFILLLFAVGFLYQIVTNFIQDQVLKQKSDYVMVDDKKLDYKLEGQGKYTLVFDGNMGTNLNQWNSVVDKLVNDYDDIQTFTYNRRGYGFSDSGSRRTLKEQAYDLKALLKKAGVSSPYILVGEQYGSLVLTEFAKEFPDLVQGVVFVNPTVVDDTSKVEFNKTYLLKRIRANIERMGSYIGFTKVLDSLKLTNSPEDFKATLDKDDLDEFKGHRVRSGYTTSIYNELKNIKEAEKNTNLSEIFKGKPYALVAKPEQEVLKSLGEENLTKVYNINSKSDIVSVKNNDSVVIAINQVVKELNQIEKKNSTKH